MVDILLKMRNSKHIFLLGQIAILSIQENEQYWLCYIDKNFLSRELVQSHLTIHTDNSVRTTKVSGVRDNYTSLCSSWQTAIKAS